MRAPFQAVGAPGTAGSQTNSSFRRADSRHIRTGAHSSGRFACPCRASGCFMLTYSAKRKSGVSRWGSLWSWIRTV